MRIEVVATAEELDRAAADAVRAVAREQPHAAIGLPSGRTPLGLYGELAQRAAAGALDLRGVTAFAIDELYGVPREHPATNASYFATHLTGRTPLRALHVLASQPLDIEGECRRFLRMIKEAGGLDLAVLGIGTNGHLAFNEPGSSFDSHARKVELTAGTRAPYAPLFGGVEHTPQFGLTLGLADLLAARRVLLLASGAAKAPAVAQALEGPLTEAVPASVLRRHERLTVILDGAAASELASSAG